MSNVAETTRMTPDSNLRLRNSTMLDLMENEENYVRNPGHVDEIKLIDNVRILTLSPRGCVPIDKSKTCMLIEAMKRHQIDVVLLNEKNTKWNAMNEERMERTLKKIGREVKMITTDSKEWNMTPKYCLPGGLMSTFFGKCKSSIQEVKKKIGKIRKFDGNNVRA